MSKTVVIQIGNTDNKLTQEDWFRFVSDVHVILGEFVSEKHFGGGSPGNAPWQNYAWICTINDACIDILKKELIKIKNEYRQDSIAFTVGDTWLCR